MRGRWKNHNDRAEGEEKKRPFPYLSSRRRKKKEKGVAPVTATEAAETEKRGRKKRFVSSIIAHNRGRSPQ